ncbi:hypothetical protein [Dokdonella sp.]|uniref:hypothetical protein n=1 Tax=Dokdonella sp. TaxID=2291710 RepID=UPI003529502E
MKCFEVDNGWEAAVETVLQGWLDAVLVDLPGSLVQELAGLAEADPTLLAAATSGLSGSADGTLAAHVRGPKPIQDMLARIRTADSMDDCARLRDLPVGHSVITAQGDWMGGLRASHAPRVPQVGARPRT